MATFRRRSLAFQSAAALLRSGAVARLIFIVTVLGAGLCAVCIALVKDARQTAWTHAIDTSRSVVAAIESDVSRTIESYDLSLQAVAENLGDPTINSLSPELRQKFLFDRSVLASHLSSISFLDADGNLRLDSRAANPEQISRAERDHFQFHKNNESTALYISRPFIARSDNAHLINVSRRINGPSGEFAGVVAGSIKLSYFLTLFEKAALGHGGNITLARTDGILLTRWPYDERFVGLNLKNADIYKHLAHDRSGHFETYSKTDGVRRLVVYSQIGDLPLLI